VVARTAQGREFDVAPDRLRWAKQPLSQNADFNRDTLELFGLRATEQPQPLVAYLGEEWSAAANVSVVRGSAAVELVDTDAFLAYPPIGSGGITYIPAGGLIGGRDLRITGDGVIIGDVGADSIFAQARLRPGTVLSEVNGHNLIGMSEAELLAYFRNNPITDGTVIRYYDPDGNLGTYRFGQAISGEFVLEARLLEVRPLNLTSSDFNAEVHLELREQAEYRLTDSSGQPLTNWQRLGPRVAATLVTGKIPRTADDSYELFLERRIGTTIKRFQLPFKLETTLQ
jgi:hypothetical protein